MDGWIKIDLTPWWSKIEIAASGRERKRMLASARMYREETHLLGLCGRQTWGAVLGLEVDYSVLPGGDGGVSFRLGDKILGVRTTKHYNDPYLRQGDEEHWPDVFLLATVNEDKHIGWAVGWLPADKVRTAPLVDLDYGPRHVRQWAELDDDLDRLYAYCGIERPVTARVEEPGRVCPGCGGTFIDAPTARWCRGCKVLPGDVQLTLGLPPWRPY